MVRSSEYGSPFRNVNSGIDESKDKVNVKRYDAGLKKFMTEAKEGEEASKYDQSMFNNVQRKYGLYYGPVLGFLFGKFYCDAFTSPKSRYAPKLITAICVLLGYKYGVNHYGRADLIFTTKNFALFPKNVQDALMTGDSRFLREYWRETGK